MNADKVFKLARGFVGRAKNCWRTAKPKVEKGLQYAYIARRLKKRLMRKIWIAQINAATRQYGMIYSEFIHQIAKQNIGLNRKMLAELAISEPYSFRSIVTRAQEAAPWRDWRAKRQSAVPQRHVFLPLSWSFTKEQHLAQRQFEKDVAAQQQLIPKMFHEKFLQLFAEPIRKAEEQNQKDLAAGKLKSLKPVWQMPLKERQAHLKEVWAGALKKIADQKAIIKANKEKLKAARAVAYRRGEEMKKVEQQQKHARSKYKGRQYDPPFVFKRV